MPLENVRLYKGRNNDCFENININDCLEYLTNEEKTHKNELYCTNCKLSDFIICNKIVTIPEILTIFLDYGNNSQFDINYLISFIIEDFDKYLIKFKNNIEYHNKRFELIGFIIYLKNNENDGIFLSYCKSKDKKWYLYYDSKVEYVDDPIQHNKGKPYLLFYKKIK